MHLEPRSEAEVVATLQAREVFTVYGRTRNAKWIVGWNKERDYGWVTTENVGCSVPIVELKPTDPQLLTRATATPIVVAQASLPTPASTQAAPSPTAAAPTNLITPTPFPSPVLSPTAVETHDSISPAQTPAATAIPEPTVGGYMPVVRIALRPNEPLTLQVEIEATPYLLTLLLAPQPVLDVTPLPTPKAGADNQRLLTCRVTAASNVNVRTAPSRESQRVTALSPNAVVQAIARSKDGRWLLIRLRDAVGWVIAEALTCEGETSQLPVSS
ncbi:MAG: SH3 domain-containing protein [Thermoflexales bacterium]|nr:SH3 domain-containing protein [Thermoflexales bacterium]MCS7324779.1 SH3 domain-containing protein [Thermoflexales bacterium]MCX7939337.1 SH3 domain-containing protein [Thermoflexales bacterium]MDW8291756.1 SH3 domain-containing protein [Anaerolineae bacterium]